MVQKVNTSALGQDVLDLIAESGGGGGGSDTIFVPVTYQLCGPDPDGAITGTATGTYSFVGSALSASSKKIFFQYGSPRVEFAQMVAVWTAGQIGNQIRLVHADDGPANITEIGALSPSAATTPVASAVNVTSALDALAQSGVTKQLLWQIRGSGTFTIFEVRLEVVWRYEINPQPV